MGRPKKPTAVKKAEGNRGKRKLNEHEPEFPDDKTGCPDWLPKYAKEEWFRLSPLLKDQQLLTEADKNSFAGYCTAYSRWRQAEEQIREASQRIQITKTGYQQLSAWETMANSCLTLMNTLGRQFGLSPSSRADITVPHQEPEDELSAFQKRVAKAG